MTVRCRYHEKRPGITLTGVTKIEEICNYLRCYFDGTTYSQIDKTEMALITIEEDEKPEFIK